MAAHLPRLTRGAYCHTLHKTLLAAVWQEGENSVGVYVCTCAYAHLQYMQVFVTELVIKWQQMNYGSSISVYMCIYPCLHEHVGVQHGCQVPEWAHPSSAIRSDQLTCSQSKQTWRRSGRHHYAAKHAVCPDPVWGPLLSADSNELPWVQIYRHPAPQWGARVGWGCWVRGQHLYNRTSIHRQTRGKLHIGRQTHFPEQRDIGSNLKWCFLIVFLFQTQPSIWVGSNYAKWGLGMSKVAIKSRFPNVKTDVFPA